MVEFIVKLGVFLFGNRWNSILYGAQNEVYNGDWTKKGLIVLCFS